MDSKAAVWLIAALFLLSSAGSVQAMFTMNMRITPPSFREGRNSTIGVELTNTGDEAGNSGVVQITHPTGLKGQPLKFDILAPNATNRGEIQVTADEGMKPGTYPLLLSLQFQDKNNYPIYMIFDSTFDVGNPSMTSIIGALSSTSFPIDGSGMLTLRVKNTGDASRTVKTRLLMPASVTSDRPDQVVEVAPYAEAQVEYNVSNFMALQDSNFMVMAAMEYDDAEHHTTTAKGRVQVGATVQEGSNGLFMWASAAVLVAAAGYVILKGGGLKNVKRSIFRKGRR